MSIHREPRDLTRVELLSILTPAWEAFYFDPETGALGPEREVSGADLVDRIGERFADLDMIPRAEEQREADAREWDSRYEQADAEHDFAALARDWQAGQWSAFDRLACAGRITDQAHAAGTAGEARRCLEAIDHTRDHGGDDPADRTRMAALASIADAYPAHREGDEEEAA